MEQPLGLTVFLNKCGFGFFFQQKLKQELKFSNPTLWFLEKYGFYFLNLTYISYKTTKLIPAQPCTLETLHVPYSQISIYTNNIVDWK